MPIWITQPDDGPWRTIDTVRFFAWLIGGAYCLCLWLFGLAAAIFGGWTLVGVLGAALVVTAIAAVVAAVGAHLAEMVWGDGE